MIMHRQSIRFGPKRCNTTGRAVHMHNPLCSRAAKALLEGGAHDAGSHLNSVIQQRVSGTYHSDMALDDSDPH